MSNKTIKSPIPGTFYNRPSPELPPYKKIDDSVNIGDIVGLVEVMKNFHEIQADVSGKIVSFEVKNEQFITAGQDLITIKTN